ncbi:MAG TPA: hypothetical protein VFV78_08285, partial [Vicinamibacterales bacterium]|nr:hypothetical protein [Vicinamibacterales bacterium]
MSCLALLAATAIVGRGAPASRVMAAAELAQFGGAVLVGDNEVFAGESANQFRAGTVYVYRKVGASWMEAMQITGPASAVGDGFGASLALDGATLFVGAGSSAVHVFNKQGANWTFASTVSATSVPAPASAATPAPTAPPAGAPVANQPTAPTGPRFGNAIAASGDWLLVGKELAGGRGRGGPISAAPGQGRAGNAPPQPAGAVYAFKRGANGQYAYHSTIAAPDAAASAGDRFGSAIALAGGTALIGASGQSSGAGIVHEFAVDTDGTWKTQRTFAPVGAQPNAAFGSALTFVNDQAVVSAPGESGG